MAHNNVHIPKESWPSWTWYAIEFAVVLAASMVIGWKISDQILSDVAMVLGHGDVLESWVGISIHSSEFKSLDDMIESKIVAMSNWIFYGILGTVFGVWYLIIRGFVFKKKIFQ